MARVSVYALSAVAVLSFAMGSPIKIQFCDNLDGSHVNLTNIDVSNVVLGETMKIKYNFNTDRPIKNGTFAFELENSGIKIPCNKQTEFGSCSYSFCRQRNYAIETTMCAPWKCKCPVKAGHYAVNNLNFPTPEIGGLLGSIIASQKTVVTIRIKENSRVISCMTFSIRAKRRGGGIFGKAKLPSTKTDTTALKKFFELASAANLTDANKEIDFSKLSRSGIVELNDIAHEVGYSNPVHFANHGLVNLIKTDSDDKYLNANNLSQNYSSTNMLTMLNRS